MKWKPIAICVSIDLAGDRQAKIQDELVSMLGELATHGTLAHVSHSVSLHYHGCKANISVVGYLVVK